MPPPVGDVVADVLSPWSCVVVVRAADPVGVCKAATHLVTVAKDVFVGGLLCTAKLTLGLWVARVRFKRDIQGLVAESACLMDMSAPPLVDQFINEAHIIVI